MSQPLYSSTFTYATQALDLFETKNEIYTNNKTQAISKSLMEIYARRSDQKVLELEKETSFVEFIQKYKISKGQLKLRDQDKQVIVVTYPTLRYNPNIESIYKEYCYYQMIKYSSWHIEDLPLLKDKNTAIQRFEAFLTTCSSSIKESIE
jgi:hypothetical protein